MTWLKPDGTPEDFQGGPTQDQMLQGKRSMTGPMGMTFFQNDMSQAQVDDNWIDVPQQDMMDSFTGGKGGMEGMGNLLAKASKIGADGTMELDHTKLAEMMQAAANDPNQVDPMAFLNGDNHGATRAESVAKAEDPARLVEKVAQAFDVEPADLMKALLARRDGGAQKSAQGRVGDRAVTEDPEDETVGERELMKRTPDRATKGFETLDAWLGHA